MSTTASLAETYPFDLDFRWEDVEIGAIALSGPYTVNDDEIVSFAERYDPLPIHVDRAAAAASRFGGLIAAGGHVLAIRQRLMHHFGWRAAVIASIGYDEVRFLAPLRGGATCRVRIEWLDKKPSSKPDRGLAVVLQTLLADDVAVLTVKDLVLMKRRAGGAA
jgi:acyl dehydratase